jgi:uncharacterized membrane protein
MKDEKQKKIQMIIVVSIVIVIGTLILITIIKKIDENKKTDTATSVDTVVSSKTGKNYIQLDENSRQNISAELVKDKKAGEILIKNTKIVYNGKESKITAKVTNGSENKSNLKLKIKVIANDDSVITETIALVGKISANESKYINATMTKDITDAKNVSYEILN